MQISDSLPTNAKLETEALKRADGVMKHAAAKPGWWPVLCTCIDNPWTTEGVCIEPTFVRPTPVDISSFCFSSETTVEVEGQGTTPMSELRIGDKVLVPSGKYDTVYSFGHRHETVDAMFLQFAPTRLEVSRDHMVKIGDRYIPASAVRVGDVLETATGVTVTIESIQTVMRQGVYAPFTMSGDIVVSNIKASNYIAFQDSDRLVVGTCTSPWTFQWLAHVSQGPHRVWVRLFGVSEETRSDEGLSIWVEFPHQCMLWYLKQNAVIMVLLLIPVLAILLVVASFEALLSCIL